MREPIKAQSSGLAQEHGAKQGRLRSEQAQGVERKE